jgi:hypothetical protein
MKSIRINIPLMVTSTTTTIAELMFLSPYTSFSPNRSTMIAKANAFHEGLEFDVKVSGSPRDIESMLAREKIGERTGIDDGPLVNQDALESTFTELQSWRNAAKLFAVHSPEELASLARLDSSEINDRKWRAATACSSPSDAQGRIYALVSELSVMKESASKKLADELSCWQSNTGCTTADGAGALIQRLRETIRLLKNFQIRVEAAEKNADELSAKLAERDQDLLSANAEIDRVKIAARTIGLASDQYAELAKTRADMHAKCREAQTEKERADAAERFARDHSIMWGRMIAAIGLEQGAAIDIVNWVEDAQKKLASAFIPLPKPEKVEPGQKWVLCVSVESLGDGYIYSGAGDTHSTMRMLRNPNWTFISAT